MNNFGFVLFIIAVAGGVALIIADIDALIERRNCTDEALTREVNNHAANR